MANNVEPGTPFGDRLQRHRKRAGMSRPVLGGLVGRSGEWVKALETGRLLTPRLPLLLRLADVLGVELGELTGEERLSAATYTKATHEQLSALARALATYTVNGGTDEPVDVVGLSARVEQTWELWHGARRQRTAIAGLLPDLLKDARTTVCRAEGTERQRALAIEAQVYHLSQLYLAFQPVPSWSS